MFRAYLFALSGLFFCNLRFHLFSSVLLCRLHFFLNGHLLFCALSIVSSHSSHSVLAVLPMLRNQIRSIQKASLSRFPFTSKRPLLFGVAMISDADVVGQQFDFQ